MGNKTSGLAAKSYDAAVGVLMAAALGAILWAMGSLIVGEWRAMRADNEYRHSLVAAAEKSEAHRFLVSN